MTQQRSNVPKWYRKANYHDRSIQRLRSVTIKEYDMKDAGFSLIRHHKLLPDNEIERLQAIPKALRHREIGIMRGARADFSKAMAECMRDTVEMFLIENDIQPKEILSIKNDAVFLIGKAKVKTTKVNGADFANKASYTSYMFINGVEYYYDSYTDRMDIKGLNGKVISAHEAHFLTFIKNLLHFGETMDDEEIIAGLAEFRESYTKRELDLPYYRTLNGENCFYVNGLTGSNFRYGLPGVKEKQRDDLDITYNYAHVVLPIISMYI